MQALDISQCLRISQFPKRRQPTEARERGNLCFLTFFEIAVAWGISEKNPAFWLISIITDQCRRFEVPAAVAASSYQELQIEQRHEKNSVSSAPSASEVRVRGCSNGSRTSEPGR